MARTARLSVMVEPALKEELQELAVGMKMPLSSLLNLLLTVAVNSTGETFAAFGATIDGMMKADEEHDEG